MAYTRQRDEYIGKILDPRRRRLQPRPAIIIDLTGTSEVIDLTETSKVIDFAGATNTPHLGNSVLVADAVSDPLQ